MEKVAIFSVKTSNPDMKRIRVYTREDERYFQDEKLAAAMLRANQKKRFKIRDYNNTFNQ